MLFFLKSYAKKSFYTVWQNYFSIKSYFTFSAKIFQFPSFGNVYYMEYTIPCMGNTVDFLPYMVETVGKKKNPAKHGEMRWTPKQ